MPRQTWKTGPAALLAAALFTIVATAPALANPDYWQREWPQTDFTKHSIEFDEIKSGGPPKDGIPSIDDPKFVALSEVTDLTDKEPVIGIAINGDMRAYPLRILIWHEIVNDTVGGVPVSVTYCPLCNAAVVFDRRVGDRVLDFGTTGKLRKSDLVMYDRQTESWWQQFTGEAIVGAMLGTTLKFVPARLESFENFRDRAPGGRVLVPNNPDMRRYGLNPYAYYDSSGAPFLYRGELPTAVPALSRVVAVGDHAWSLDHLRNVQRIETDDGLVVTWTPGQNSAMDTPNIEDGKDVGNVIVQRRESAGGDWVDVPYRVDFAFAFFAFRPDVQIVTP